jgi:hypothetical protein
LRCGATGSAADSKGAFLSRPLAIDFRPEDEHPRLTMLVTRAEEWCVEAETAEEARELLATGHGHRCHLGDRVHLELQAVDE